MVVRTNFKVLVADDHFIARQMVGTALQEHNITNVVMTGDGQSTIDAIQSAYKGHSPFQIVFLDWDMPNGTGMDVLNLFRKIKAFDNTAFVMLTAASQQTEIMQAIKAGATSYIVKPVSRVQMDTKIKEICDWVRKMEIKGK